MICGLVRPGTEGYDYVDVVGVYDNIVMANECAFAVYSTTAAYAICLDRYNVSVKCLWDGKPFQFDEEGNKVYYEYVPTEKENIAELQYKNGVLEKSLAATNAMNEELTLALAELAGGE